MARLLSSKTAFVVVLTIYSGAIIANEYNVTTCSNIPYHQRTYLQNCAFVNSSDIKCYIYALANQSDSQIFAINVTIQYATVLYLREELEVFRQLGLTQKWWCLGVRAVTVTKVTHPPHNASNELLNLPEKTASVLNSVRDESRAYVEFGPNKETVGLIKLAPHCKPLTDTDPECISELWLASYFIAPANLISHSGTDDLFEKTMLLYFDRLKGRVKELRLSAINFGSYDSRWLGELSRMRLESLNASHNNFNRLTRRLTGMEDLKVLNLSHCAISNLDPGNLEGSPNLKYFDLSHNALPEVPHQIGSLVHLLWLDLSYQRVLTFDLGKELTALPMLRELRLNDIPLRNISSSVLPTNLRALELRGCKLTHLTTFDLSQFTKLRVLDLSANRLKSIPSTTMLSSLAPGAVVSLSRNQLTEVKDLEVRDMALLDLSHNKITSPRRMIRSGSIGKLDLDHNHILNWTTPKNETIRLNEGKVFNLSLSNNKIAMINQEMGRSLRDLETVDLGGNTIDCQDCGLEEFKVWINETDRPEVLINGVNAPLKCALPPRQLGELVIDAVFNETACRIQVASLLLPLGIPTGVLLTLTIILALLGYIYRYELSYTRHLLRVKKRAKETGERTDCTYDMFVSYSSKDRGWVLEILLPTLEDSKLGYQLCLHERDFKLGSFIMDNVVDCLDKSRRTLLVLSNNFIASEWCQWELRMAQHRLFENSSDFLILLELERISRESLPLHLRELMASRTYLEWPGNSASATELSHFWVKLRRVLGSPLSKTNPTTVPLTELHPNGEPSEVDSEEEDELLKQLFEETLGRKVTDEQRK